MNEATETAMDNPFAPKPPTAPESAPAAPAPAPVSSDSSEGQKPKIEITRMDEHGWLLGLVDGEKVGYSYSESALRDYCANWPAHKAKRAEFHAKLREEKAAREADKAKRSRPPEDDDVSF